jgi:hypothetical protein
VFDGSEMSEDVLCTSSRGQGDLPLLEKTLGHPMMMEHLGGPESPESIAQRQTGYDQENSRQFKIVEVATGAGMGGDSHL